MLHLPGPRAQAPRASRDESDCHSAHNHTRFLAVPTRCSDATLVYLIHRALAAQGCASVTDSTSFPTPHELLQVFVQVNVMKHVRRASLACNGDPMGPGAGVASGLSRRHFCTKFAGVCHSVSVVVSCWLPEAAGARSAATRRPEPLSVSTAWFRELACKPSPNSIFLSSYPTHPCRVG